MITAQSIIDIKNKALIKGTVTIDESDLLWKMDRDSYIKIRTLHVQYEYFWGINLNLKRTSPGELLNIPIKIVEEIQEPVFGFEKADFA